MPRPDITDGLGITYRRIPILAIGRDVYCDTRIIMAALETKYPDGALGGKTAADKGIQKLFEVQTISGGVFWRAAALLPVWRHPFLQDPKFQEDRAELTGGQWNANALLKARPNALAHLCEAFDLLETTFLADGRKWVLGNDESPSLADIDAVFPLQWIVRDPLMEGAVSEEHISAAKYPRTFAWIDRFLGAAQAAAARAPPVTRLEGSDAVSKILAAPAGAFDTHAVPGDPLGLRIGDPVTVSTADLATRYLDHGVLVTLTTHEVCILNSKRIRLHFPRWNFHIAAADADAADAAEEPTAPAPPDLRLIYHPLSPFSRKAYMVARELGLAHRLALEQVVVAPVAIAGWSDDNERVAASNPLAKIPTLVTGAGDGVYDSRVIADYLVAEAGRAGAGGATAAANADSEQRRWRLEAVHACADGILDAKVLLIDEDHIRTAEGLRFEKWVVGQTEKIDRGFDWLEMEAARGTLPVLKAEDVASVPEVAVAAALGYMDVVRHEWRDERPKLAEWFKTWETRESFAMTKPDMDWKTGDPKPLGFAPGTTDK